MEIEMKLENVHLGFVSLLLIGFISALITDLLILQSTRAMGDAIKRMGLEPNEDCSPINVSLQMVCAFVEFNKDLKDVTDRTAFLVNGIGITTLVLLVLV